MKNVQLVAMFVILSLGSVANAADIKGVECKTEALQKVIQLDQQTYLPSEARYTGSYDFNGSAQGVKIEAITNSFGIESVTLTRKGITSGAMAYDQQENSDEHGLPKLSVLFGDAEVTFMMTCYAK